MGSGYSTASPAYSTSTTRPITCRRGPSTSSASVRKRPMAGIGDGATNCAMSPGAVQGLIRSLVYHRRPSRKAHNAIVRGPPNWATSAPTRKDGLCRLPCFGLDPLQRSGGGGCQNPDRPSTQTQRLALDARGRPADSTCESMCNRNDGSLSGTGTLETTSEPYPSPRIRALP